jgi:hypothetical protein
MHRFARILPMLLAVLAVLALPGLAAAAPAGSTFLVSRPDGTGAVTPASDNGSSGPLAVSADGRYVAFVSAADGFAPGANPRVTNVFVRDTVTNLTTLASRSDGAEGAGVNADVEHIDNAKIGIAVEPGATAADGPHDRPHVLVAFSTRATDLVDHATGTQPATAGREEVWMRDLTAGTTYLVSRASGMAGAPADGRSRQPSIAVGPGGPLVAFASESTNLGRLGRVSQVSNVFLREVAPGVTHMVSCPQRNCAGGASGGPSFEPSLRFVDGIGGSEACGREERCALVAFTTGDPSIVPQASPTDTQIAVASALEESEGTGLGEFDRWAIGSSVYLQPSVPGNASSLRPALASDGEGVAFISQATNLAPYGPRLPENPAEGYYRSFTAAGPTTLVTVGHDALGPVGANQIVSDISLGGNFRDGWRYAFDGNPTNLGTPPDPLGLFHSFVVKPGVEPLSRLDRVAGAATDVVGNVAGAPGNSMSEAATISADGSSAVFASRSTNLNAGGGDFERVYLRRVDPAAPDFDSLQLVSRPSGTDAFSPGSKSAGITHSATSANGRFVAFQSDANDLSESDDDRVVNVFVRDTVNGTTTLVSRAAGAKGAAADADSQLNGISEDGQRVLFTTSAPDFGTPGQQGPHAYVRDLAAQTTTVVTRGDGANAAVTVGEGLSISGDGNRVAFRTVIPLEPEAENGFSHLYVRDLAAQTTTLVDRSEGPLGGVAEGTPFDASLDRDGGRVAWDTDAVLVPDTGGFRKKIYLRDLTAGTTTLVSRADGPAGVPAAGDALAPAIDAAGDAVAFESEADLGTAVGHRAIWVRRIPTGSTELVSRASGATGAPAEEASFGPSIDAAGDRVAFTTHSDNLGTQPPPVEVGSREFHGSEVYVRDLKTKTTELASRVSGVAGPPADPAGFGIASLSASGDCIAFSGTGANYTDALASADFRMVRERVLRGSCGPVAPPSSAGVAESPPIHGGATLSDLAMRPTTFYVGPGGGTNVSFVLSRASSVTISFQRLLRPAGGPRPAERLVGSVVVRGFAGRNALHLSGRMHGHALAPGPYRWTAQPLSGPGTSGRFVVVRAPQR